MKRETKKAIITLLTDFGMSSPYVAAMKGVILGIHPEARIIDISHTISPQNTNEAAYILKKTYSFFPKGTIHVVVVDPEVGSPRAILAVKTDGFIFLAPDNGVLKYIFDDHPNTEVYEVSNKAFFRHPVSQTFHGRDIFAPVSAHLSRGLGLYELGERTESYQKGEIHQPQIESNRIVGELIYFDHFGNAITNIESSLMADWSFCFVESKGTVFKKIMTTYSDVASGEPLVFWGSSDTLEIAVNQDSARQILNLEIGDRVIVHQ